VFQYFNAKINGEEKNLEQIELQKKGTLSKTTKQGHAHMLLQKEERKKNWIIGKKDTQLKRKKKTLHKWTPDSARLLDAYLSVGYGVLQCSN